jgi:hypothetical protein
MSENQSFMCRLLVGVKSKKGQKKRATARIALLSRSIFAVG